MPTETGRRGAFARAEERPGCASEMSLTALCRLHTTEVCALPLSPSVMYARAQLPVPASHPPPVRFLARAPLPATTVAAATISAVCSRTTQMRKSRRLATASALSRGSGPSHRLETAAPRVTRAAQAHAASLAQQSRPSRGARGEGEEGEEEAQWQMGAVPVGADEGCAVAVAVPAELPQPSCRGASPPVRVH